MRIWQDRNTSECFKVFYVKFYVHSLVDKLKWLQMVFSCLWKNEMDAFFMVCASLFTGLAVWICSPVASSGDAFIFWGLRFLGYDAALMCDRFPTFIRKAVPSPSRVRTLNPLWYNFFFSKLLKLFTQWRGVKSQNTFLNYTNVETSRLVFDILFQRHWNEPDSAFRIT